MFLCCAQISHAQKLKDFIKKTTDNDFIKKTTQNIGDGLTDAVSQAVADKIVEKAVTSLEGKLDTLLNAAFQIDSTSRAAGGDTINYFDYLNGLNQADKVPDQYSFYMGLATKTTDEDGRTTESIHYFNKDGDYFGMLVEGSLMILDAKNEIIANFNMENKTGFAMGKSLMKSVGSMVDNKLFLDFDITKTSETKSILGYSCQKYIGTATDYSFETYIAKDFPINMYDAYANIVSLYLDQSVADAYKEINGMSLESKTIMDDGETYYTVATKVIETGLTLSKADYNFNLE